MFSEELREMDRNTVQYMIDEMQKTIDAQSAALEEEKKRHAAVLEEALRRIEELERKNGSESVK